MNRIVHFEMHSSDPEKSNAFFEGVFGWKINKWEGPMPYWLMTTGESGPGIDGGLMESQDGQPRTVNTIQVESIEDHAAKVEKAGGQIVVPKMSIPGVGYVAYCTDPTGVLFGIYVNDPNAE